MWSVRKSKERNINIVGVCETKWENKENLAPTDTGTDMQAEKRTTEDLD